MSARIIDGKAIAKSIREQIKADIERIDTLTLEDFAAPLSDVRLPQKGEGERLTAEEMNTAVESFLQSLQER